MEQKGEKRVNSLSSWSGHTIFPALGRQRSWYPGLRTEGFKTNNPHAPTTSFQACILELNLTFNS